MIPNFRTLRRSLFGITIEAMDSSWQKLDVPDSIARHEIRESCGAFMNAYNVVLEVGFSEELTTKLKLFGGDLEGYAYQGASMGLTMLDYMSPLGGHRFEQFVSENPNHISLAHIGAGFVISVLKRDLEKCLSKMIPMERWWAIDGFGFHAGAFNWKNYVDKQTIPQRFKGYASRAFDQGLGRGIWFLYGGDVLRVTKQIQSFPLNRHGDLWSGVGLASTYTPGINEETFHNLKVAADDQASYLALGAALAANPLHLTNNIVDHTNLACSIFCGMSAVDAAQLTLKIKPGLTTDEPEAVFVDHPIYETYRETLRKQFIQNPVAL